MTYLHGSSPTTNCPGPNSCSFRWACCVTSDVCLMMCVYPSMRYAEDEHSEWVKGLAHETIKKYRGTSIYGVLL